MSTSAGSSKKEDDSSSSKIKGRKLGSGDSYLMLNVLPVGEEIFYKLNSEIRWPERLERMPRDIAIQATVKVENGEEIEPLYRHPSPENPRAHSWTPNVLYIKNKLENIFGQDLNHALIQRYKSGRDYIGEHCDKTLDIKIGTAILDYSVGATRTMTLRNKKNRHITQEFKLPHNSLFVMGWKTNREWLHSVQRDLRDNRDKDSDELLFGGRRISFTMRHIATFRNRDNGKLVGQGARKKNPDMHIEGEDVKLLRAYSSDNKMGLDFDWNRIYGCGFNVIDLKNLRSNNRDRRNFRKRPIHHKSYGNKWKPYHDRR